MFITQRNSRWKTVGGNSKGKIFIGGKCVGGNWLKLGVDKKEVSCYTKSNKKRRLMKTKRERAIEIANGAFAKARYGTHPYIYHLNGVAEMSEKYAPTNKDTHYIVGMLHDLLEDFPDYISYMDLIGEFGTDILISLDFLTKRDSETYMEYIERCSYDKIAEHVKICDLLFNSQHMEELRDSPHKLFLLERYNKALIYMAGKKEW